MDVLIELERRLDERLAALEGRVPDASGSAATGDLDGGAALALLEDMLRSRVLDVLARELRAEGRGFYTIGSSGHEMNAVVGALTRPTDPALLHYRSGGFMMARSRRASEEAGVAVDPVADTIRSLLATRDDPASGGRHKVWGSVDLAVPPQTSTIASHLPKAVGLAIALGRPQRAKGRLVRPAGGRAGISPLAPAPLGALAGPDPVVVCSFGDASFNHATAQTAFGAARWARRQGSAVPILFVCEDNGIGISVPTPQGWIADSVRGMDGIDYVLADGPLDAVHAEVARAVDLARYGRGPVLLHLRTVRLGGHAGSDPEAAYRDRAAIEADMERDPVALALERIVALGLADAATCAALVARVRVEVREAVGPAAAQGTILSADEVIRPLAPHRPVEIVARAAALALDEDARRAVANRRLPEELTQPGERTLAARINQALREELARRPDTVLFGEDVGRRGGVYGVTTGLQEVHGSARVHDTLLDETSILGMAQGYGLAGALPLPEIQYLAYVHNALDQLRGEACSTSFFSDGRFTTPMVVRIAGLAYQRGFGGHFHNDDSIGALRDIPGLALAVPSRGDDAVRMLRAALGMAEVDGRVVAFLEPIALYHERDLHEPGDGGWLTDFPVATGGPDDLLLPGEVGLHGPDEADTLVVTYGNGVRMALRAAARSAREGGSPVRVLDLRWLNPLPMEAVRRAARDVRRVIVADECRATGGGIADAVVADLAEHGAVPQGGVVTLRAMDSYVPIGPAADLVLVGEDDLMAALQR
jgi:2-oxoisovalerate dehydrogenase E1 component